METGVREFVEGRKLEPEVSEENRFPCDLQRSQGRH